MHAASPRLKQMHPFEFFIRSFLRSHFAHFHVIAKTQREKTPFRFTLESPTHRCTCKFHKLPRHRRQFPESQTFGSRSSFGSLTASVSTVTSYWRILSLSMHNDALRRFRPKYPRTHTSHCMHICRMCVCDNVHKLHCDMCMGTMAVDVRAVTFDWRCASEWRANALRVVFFAFCFGGIFMCFEHGCVKCWIWWLSVSEVAYRW